jgi:hypothetical protein
LGIYYFAVDYDKKKQMWSPHNFSDKCIDSPGHPLPAMVTMKNLQGWNFQFVNDVSTFEEHSYEDITEEVFKEWLEKFKDWDLSKYK